MRRRWRLVAALPLLVAIISGSAALLRPARYAVPMRLLVTRDAQAGGVAGLSDRREDTTAQDLPAILQSTAFRGDLAAELARRGRHIAAEALAGTIAAGYSEHTVSITVVAASPAEALAIADALIAVLRAQGLRYWGGQPDRPGLQIGVLDPPAQAARLGSLRALVIEVSLRAAAGLGLAAGLALLLHHRAHGRPAPMRDA